MKVTSKTKQKQKNVHDTLLYKAALLPEGLDCSAACLAYAVHLISFTGGAIFIQNANV